MAMHFRFRVRALLLAITLAAVTIGGARWWYDSSVAAFHGDLRALHELETVGIQGSSTYCGPPGGALIMHALDEVRRVTRLSCDEADAVDPLIEHLPKLDQVEVIQMLGRQIVPRLDHATAEEPDGLLRVLTNHPSLRQVIVDASIRGAPLDFDAPVYTRADLARLDAALPGLEIIWIEVN